ncbi:DUF309 domain-containing protein [Evansella clarkii]|uniref:DUF309 domain-containing protein n=1 Tax=Evansella clarkii TaxID=79879 RepID=UPI001472C0AC|nr:DUF309 domain-containing protein [Evansella clarkii]
MNRNYPEAYLEYLFHFHATRDFFECHEVMEEYWKANKNIRWLALIQIAVAVYHERAGNMPGSLRLYRKVLCHIRKDPEIFAGLGINTDELTSIVRLRIKNIIEEGVYEPLNLPISDPELIKNCKDICARAELDWCTSENLDDNELIFRHKLRDRSEVIEERLASLTNKQRERKGS